MPKVSDIPPVWQEESKPQPVLKPERLFYASIMGSYAAEILCEGKSNRVVAHSKGEFVDFDIDEALAMQKEISEYEYRVSKMLSM